MDLQTLQSLAGGDSSIGSEELAMAENGNRSEKKVRIRFEQMSATKMLCVSASINVCADLMRSMGMG